MQTEGKLQASGDVTVRHFRANPIIKPAPRSWKLRNNLQPRYLKGLFAEKVMRPLANASGLMTGIATLEIRHRKFNPAYLPEYLTLKEGQKRFTPGSAMWIALQDQLDTMLEEHSTWIDYGVVSRRVITDAGVAFLVDDWDNNGQDLTTLNFHGCGTGVAAEAVGDTALGTESTTALNPDNTRATGTRSQPAANQYRSVGTLTFDASAAITEHGLFSQSATGGGTLWDRSTFSAINVVNLDSIQFTYTVSLTSGG